MWAPDFFIESNDNLKSRVQSQSKVAKVEDHRYNWIFFEEIFKVFCFI